MKIFKIALYGDSIACARQGVVESFQRYIALVDVFVRTKDLNYIEIRDNAIGGATLPELYNLYLKDNTYFSLPGDLLIIQSGIVDCAPRPISDSLRSKISKLPKLIRNLAISYLHRNRRRLILKGKGYVRTNKIVFKNTLEKFLQHAASNYKTVIVVNICPTTPHFDKHSPGLSDSIALYNNIIDNTVEKLNVNNVFVLDIYNRVFREKGKITEYIVEADGHHIHPITHKIISEEIIEKCKELL
ncbi:MAG: SGNH/GDSL hydrolase family protein [Sphingobacteriaceae bacterium]|nr:SGNH/GDSL hydrolase family protein [Sphingobacteriaceae bacterium]